MGCGGIVDRTYSPKGPVEEAVCEDTCTHMHTQTHTHFLNRWTIMCCIKNRETTSVVLPTMSFLICSVMGMGLTASGEMYLVKIVTASFSIPAKHTNYLSTDAQVKLFLQVVSLNYQLMHQSNAHMSLPVHTVKLFQAAGLVPSW